MPCSSKRLLKLPPNRVLRHSYCSSWRWSSPWGQSDRPPSVMRMGAGYWSEDDAKSSAVQGIDAYNRSTEAKGYATGRL